MGGEEQKPKEEKPPAPAAEKATKKPDSKEEFLSTEEAMNDLFDALNPPPKNKMQ